jgi:hypothetical protein
VQWLRCGPDATACSPIAGATGLTYAVTSADVDSTIVSRVTATNATGSASRDSAPTGVVVALAPTTTDTVTLSGAAAYGETLAASTVHWTGTEPIRQSATWERCDADGTGCAPIVGASGTTHVTAADDIGRRLRIRVAASNAAGADERVSDLTPTVTGGPPAADPGAPPQVTGTLRDGELVTASTGAWTGSQPITFSYQWQSCAGPGDCRPIPGASDATYRLTAAEIGRSIAVEVTAANAIGTASSSSQLTNPVAAITPPPPSGPPAGDPTSPPRISGVLRVGETVSATTGGWSGAQPMTFSYQWISCNATFLCSEIVGATSPTYVLTAAEAGRRLSVDVTARNAEGAETRSSQPTELRRLVQGGPMQVAA